MLQMLSVENRRTWVVILLLSLKITMTGVGYPTPPVHSVHNVVMGYPIHVEGVNILPKIL